MILASFLRRVPSSPCLPFPFLPCRFLDIADECMAQLDDSRAADSKEGEFSAEVLVYMMIQLRHVEDRVAKLEDKIAAAINRQTKAYEGKSS